MFNYKQGSYTLTWSGEKKKILDHIFGRNDSKSTKKTSPSNQSLLFSSYIWQRSTRNRENYLRPPSSEDFRVDCRSRFPFVGAAVGSWGRKTRTSSLPRLSQLPQTQGQPPASSLAHSLISNLRPRALQEGSGRTTSWQTRTCKQAAALSRVTARGLLTSGVDKRPLRSTDHKRDASFIK